MGQEISDKIQYSAKVPPDSRTRDLYQHPKCYSFVHYFRVSYKIKSSQLQLFSEKVEVPIKSASPHVPSEEQIVKEFEQLLSILGKTKRDSSSKAAIGAAYKITNVEYKRSVATKA